MSTRTTPETILREWMSSLQTRARRMEKARHHTPPGPEVQKSQKLPTENGFEMSWAPRLPGRTTRLMTLTIHRRPETRSRVTSTTRRPHPTRNGRSASPHLLTFTPTC